MCYPRPIRSGRSLPKVRTWKLSFWTPSSPAAFSILAVIRDIPVALPHFISLIALFAKQVGYVEVGPSLDRLFARVQAPIKLYIWKAPIVYIPDSLLSHAIQEQPSGIIADQFVILDIQVSVSHLVVPYNWVCETSVGCLRSIYPSLGMIQLFGDVTMGKWRQN